MPLMRRWLLSCILACALLFALFSSLSSDPRWTKRTSPDELPISGFFNPKIHWRNLPQKHPVESFIHLPTGSPIAIPKIQHDFKPENPEHAAERCRRLQAVKKAFVHSWDGYRTNAWRQDEVSPLTGESSNPFGGWGATLVDSLDTLWIMGMETEFKQAVSEIKKIDFTTSHQTTINIFETTIRYLGGLLSAYDISGHKHDILLRKAVELGDTLYAAFDTPNRMPVTRWDWKKAALGNDQEALGYSLLAELGSLSLEFTRLSQLTGNHKWYDAIARITNVFEESQSQTKIPGLWPVFLDAREALFKKDYTFSLGGMADSFYEYIPKQHLLLGGHNQQYRTMYITALRSLKEHIFFRPLTPDPRKMLIPGFSQRFSVMDDNLQPNAEHLGCFAGGMVALAAKAFQNDQDLKTARELLDGCLWAYESMPTGIMPESFIVVPCPAAADDAENCTWNETEWYHAVLDHRTGREDTPAEDAVKAQSLIEAHNLVPGFVEITDARYILRPEAIESLFVLYRTTGDESLQDEAWAMFQAINNATRTSIAHAAIEDVTDLHSEHLDSMESFWTAETLKYFYLVFSEPDVVSLDDYVL